MNKNKIKLININFKIKQPHPRAEKDLHDLHDKAQREFHDYVINQRSIRQQQQKIQVSLAIANNDADIILSNLIKFAANSR